MMKIYYYRKNSDIVWMKISMRYRCFDVIYKGIDKTLPK